MGVVRALLALLLLTGTAGAERYVMQRGETLEHVATAKGCSVELLMRVNNVKTTLILRVAKYEPGVPIT